MTSLYHCFNYIINIPDAIKNEYIRNNILNNYTECEINLFLCIHPEYKKYLHNTIKTIVNVNKYVRATCKFNKYLNKQYSKCVVTGKSSIFCENAHILPFKYCTIEEANDPDNGFKLCFDIHKLWDENIICLKPLNDTEAVFCIINKEYINDAAEFIGRKIINITPSKMLYIIQRYNMDTIC